MPTNHLRKGVFTWAPPSNFDPCTRVIARSLYCITSTALRDDYILKVPETSNTMFPAAVLADSISDALRISSRLTLLKFDVPFLSKVQQPRLSKVDEGKNAAHPLRSTVPRPEPTRSRRVLVRTRLASSGHRHRDSFGGARVSLTRVRTYVDWLPEENFSPSL